MTKILRTVIAATIVMMASTAHAGLDPALKCQASKDKIVGAYYACRTKVAATAVAKSIPADYTKCISKFMEKWAKAESVGGAACPDTVSSTALIEDFVADQANETAGIVAGADIPTAPTCGDGEINAGGEHCDGSNLDGLTCASFGLYGTLACTPGCSVDLSGCSACPPSTVSYEGNCYVLGAQGSSCDAACAAVGLVYDDATLTETGSEGTDGNCLAVLSATNAPGDVLNNPGGSCAAEAAGCMVLPMSGFRARCGTPATTSTEDHPDARRVCACY